MRRCMKNQNKLSFEERQIRRRNQKRNALRFNQGIKEVFSKKLKFIIFLLYVIATIFIWFLFVYTPSDYKNIFKLLYKLSWFLILRFTVDWDSDSILSIVMLIFGLNVIVAINRFLTDTEKEIERSQIAQIKTKYNW